MTYYYVLMLFYPLAKKAGGEEWTTAMSAVWFPAVLSGLASTIFLPAGSSVVVFFAVWLTGSVIAVLTGTE